MKEEEFREIKGYEEDYQVSNLGRVLSLKHGKERILKQSFTGIGYLKVGLHKNGKSSPKKVHQLVAIAFLGHIPDGHNICVDHVDNDKLNNNVTNLQLITNRENCSKDSRKNIGKYKGVTYSKRDNSWWGRVTYQGKSYGTTTVKTELEAYELYKELLNKLGLVNYNKEENV